MRRTFTCMVSDFDFENDDGRILAEVELLTMALSASSGTFPELCNPNAQDPHIHHFCFFHTFEGIDTSMFLLRDRNSLCSV